VGVAFVRCRFRQRVDVEDEVEDEVEDKVEDRETKKGRKLTMRKRNTGSIRTHLRTTLRDAIEGGEMEEGELGGNHTILRAV
jgi:hypothetical protein